MHPTNTRSSTVPSSVSLATNHSSNSFMEQLQAEIQKRAKDMAIASVQELSNDRANASVQPTVVTQTSPHIYAEVHVIQPPQDNHDRLSTASTDSFLTESDYQDNNDTFYQPGHENVAPQMNAKGFVTQTPITYDDNFDEQTQISSDFVYHRPANVADIAELALRHRSTYAAIAILSFIGAVTAAVIGAINLAKANNSEYDEEGNNAELSAEKEFVDSERAEYLDPNTSDERRAEIASHYNETIINGQVSPEFSEMTQTGKDALATTAQAARHDAIESAREKDKNSANILLGTIGLSGLIGLLTIGKLTYNVHKNKQIRAMANGYEYHPTILNKVDNVAAKVDKYAIPKEKRNYHPVDSLL